MLAHARVCYCSAILLLALNNSRIASTRVRIRSLMPVVASLQAHSGYRAHADDTRSRVASQLLALITRMFESRHHARHLQLLLSDHASHTLVTLACSR